MAGKDDETPGGQEPGVQPNDDQHGQRDIPSENSNSQPGSMPPDPFPADFDYAEEWKGDVSATTLTEAEEERRRELHKAAVRYWEMGFRVIPLHWVVATGKCSCGKDSCESIGKHPYFGKWQKPTTPADTDSGWWRLLAANEQNPVDWLPRANIGILTGEVSGVFVLDIDCKEHDGFAALARLETQHPDEPIPATLIVQTGSGGRHYFFRHPGWNVSNSKPWGPEAGIDIKGDAGQVVAAPSLSGYGPYVIAANVSSVRQIPEAPSWLLERIQEHDARQHGEVVGNPPVVPDETISAYMDAVLKGNAKTLSESTPNSDRNITLNKCAWRLGRFGAHGWITETQAWEALRDVAWSIGLGKEETRNTFRSGWRAGLEEPADLSKIGEIKDHDFQTYPWNDFGLADRLVMYFGQQLRYCTEKEAWLIYQSGTWHYCSDSEPQRLAQDMIRMMPEVEAKLYSDVAPEPGKPSPRKLFRTWHAGICNRTRVASTVVLARDRPAVRVAVSRLDEDELCINVKNGLYHAASRELTPHEAGQLVTMQAGVAYDPAATCPLWDEFLEQMQPDPEIRAFLYRCWGYSLTADLSERAFFLHHGPTATGKSVMNNVISSIAGTYSQTVPVETLLLSTGGSGGIPTDIARMDGRRYLSASETRAGKQLNEALVKQLTGGDTMAARFLHKDFFEFKPTGKIHLISNHLVHLTNDDATQDRIHLFKWDQSVPRAQRDKRFAGRIITNEASGVFNRLLAGLEDWLARGGLDSPEAAEEHKTAYLKSEDWREHFVEACCNIVPYEKCLVGRSTTELYGVYKVWYVDTHPGSRAMSLETFKQQLSDKYPYAEGKTKDRKHWRGFPTLEIRPYFGGDIQSI